MSLGALTSVDWQTILTAVVPTLLAATVVALLARRIAERLLRTAVGDHLTVSSPAVRGPLRLIAIAAFVLTISVMLTPALELAGLSPRAGRRLGALADWGLNHGVRVVLVAVIAYALVKTTTLLVRRFEHQVSRGTTLDALERAKRARTLGSLIQRVVSAAISTAAVLIILDEFGVNITPVLTGAGIAGLAVGFGAQTLVRDIISGFFMILEDQVRVGDVASINGTGGLVEQINVRTIVLRDEQGTVHVFPNGSINTLANLSKDFSFAVIVLSLSYHEDTDRITQLLREIGDELQRDPRFAPFILAPVEIFGIDGFGDWSMQLKLRVKTVPLKQWDVGRELRRRIRIAFDKAGVHIPYPAIAAVPAPSRDRGPEKD